MKRLLAAIAFAASVAFGGGVSGPPASTTSGSGGGGDVYAASNNTFTGDNTFGDVFIGPSGASLSPAATIRDDGTTNNSLVTVSNGAFYGSMLSTTTRFLVDGATSGVYIAGSQIYIGSPPQLKITLILDDESTLSGAWAVDPAHDDEYGNRIARQGWVSNKVAAVLSGGVSITQALVGVTNVYINGILTAVNP